MATSALPELPLHDSLMNIPTDVIADAEKCTVEHEPSSSQDSSETGPESSSFRSTFSEQIHGKPKPSCDAVIVHQKEERKVASDIKKQMEKYFKMTNGCFCQNIVLKLYGQVKSTPLYGCIEDVCKDCDQIILLWTPLFQKDEQCLKISQTIKSSDISDIIVIVHGFNGKEKPDYSHIALSDTLPVYYHKTDDFLEEMEERLLTPNSYDLQHESKGARKQQKAFVKKPAEMNSGPHSTDRLVQSEPPSKHVRNTDQTCDDKSLPNDVQRDYSQSLPTHVVLQSKCSGSSSVSTRSQHIPGSHKRLETRQNVSDAVLLNSHLPPKLATVSEPSNTNMHEIKGRKYSNDCEKIENNEVNSTGNPAAAEATILNQTYTVDQTERKIDEETKTSSFFQVRETEKSNEGPKTGVEKAKDYGQDNEYRQIEQMRSQGTAGLIQSEIWQSGQIGTQGIVSQAIHSYRDASGVETHRERNTPSVKIHPGKYAQAVETQEMQPGRDAQATETQKMQPGTDAQAVETHEMHSGRDAQAVETQEMQPGRDAQAVETQEKQPRREAPNVVMSHESPSERDVPGVETQETPSERYVPGVETQETPSEGDASGVETHETHSERHTLGVETHETPSERNAPDVETQETHSERDAPGVKTQETTSERRTPGVETHETPSEIDAPDFETQETPSERETPAAGTEEMRAEGATAGIGIQKMDPQIASVQAKEDFKTGLGAKAHSQSSGLDTTANKIELEPSKKSHASQTKHPSHKPVPAHASADIALLKKKEQKTKPSHLRMRGTESVPTDTEEACVACEESENDETDLKTLVDLQSEEETTNNEMECYIREQTHSKQIIGVDTDNVSDLGPQYPTVSTREELRRHHYETISPPSDYMELAGTAYGCNLPVSLDKLPFIDSEYNNVPAIEIDMPSKAITEKYKKNAVDKIQADCETGLTNRRMESDQSTLSQIPSSTGFQVQTNFMLEGTTHEIHPKSPTFLEVDYLEGFDILQGSIRPESPTALLEDDLKGFKPLQGPLPPVERNRIYSNSVKYKIPVQESQPPEDLPPAMKPAVRSHQTLVRKYSGDHHTLDILTQTTMTTPSSPTSPVPAFPNTVVINVERSEYLHIGVSDGQAVIQHAPVARGPDELPGRPVVQPASDPSATDASSQTLGITTARHGTTEDLKDDDLRPDFEEIRPRRLSKRSKVLQFFCCGHQKQKNPKKRSSRRGVTV